MKGDLRCRRHSLTSCWRMTPSVASQLFMTNKLLISAPLIAAGVAGILYARSRLPSYLRKDRVAVITGGSSGLGLALAHRFGRAGLKLVLAARTMNDLERAKLELVSRKSVANEADVHLFACDLSDRGQAEALIGAAVERFGTVDMLINNAGVIEVGPMEDHPVEAYERSMAVNFFSAVYTSHAALPILLAKKESAIVNISSVGGKVAVPHLLPYVASKFALTGFSEGMHVELRQRGVRVTTVCPGLMRTGGETHAEFRGQIEKEKAWFQTAARMPILAANVTRAAERIFSAVKDRRAEITITPQAWLAARFAGIAPESTQLISALVNSLVLPST
jgi:short-subunit dehydrogenase